MSTIVATQYGSIEGERRGAHSAFLGIPYAKPPLGSLRFRAPEPPEPWTGVRPARAWGAAAIQGKAFAPGVLAEGKLSEDCLFLNVYTPAADGAKRPVMFWIHGGAFTVGTAGTALYDGGPLAHHDVVVVTFNYRLGALGYLGLGDEGKRFGAVENRGAHDQLAALAWVRDNIERFGGDPDNITLFGESAGGTAVSLLVATPRARGMFRRAIVQSSSMPPQLPTAEFYAESRAIMQRALGLKAHELERLNEVPIDLIVSAQAKVEEQLRFPHYAPVFDGVLYPEQPRTLLENGEGSAVPMIVGSTRDEWNLFALANFNDWSIPLPDATLLAEVETRLPARSQAGAGTLIDTYRSSRRARGLPHDNRALLRAIDGDRVFRLTALRLAELTRANHRESYVYLFTYGSPALGGALGACHALELPFVFGTYGTPLQERFVGKGPRVNALSCEMMALWTSFARGDKPSCEGCPEWSTHAPERYATLELAQDETRIVDDPYGEERKAWEGLL